MVNLWSPFGGSTVAVLRSAGVAGAVEGVEAEEEENMRRVAVGAAAAVAAVARARGDVDEVEGAIVEVGAREDDGTAVDTGTADDGVMGHVKREEEKGRGQTSGIRGREATTEENTAAVNKVPNRNGERDDVTRRSIMQR